MSFALNQLNGFNAFTDTAGGGVTISYRTTVGAELSASTYTFSSTDIGAESADRIVVLCIAARGSSGASRTINSVTVAGNSATSIANPGNVPNHTDVYICPLASGTTADIVVTFSGSVVRMGVSVYATTGMSSTATSTNTADTSSPFSATVDVPAGGAAFGVVMDFNTQTGAAWTNLDEDFDGSVSQWMSSASKVFATQQSSLNIQCTVTSSGSRMAVATFGPA